MRTESASDASGERKRFIASPFPPTGPPIQRPPIVLPVARKINYD